MAAAPVNHRFFWGGGERPTLRESGGASRGPPGTTTLQFGVPTEHTTKMSSRSVQVVVQEVQGPLHLSRFCSTEPQLAPFIASRSQAKQLASSGCILVDNEPRKHSHLVKNGEVVSLILPGNENSAALTVSRGSVTAVDDGVSLGSFCRKSFPQVVSNKACRRAIRANDVCVNGQHEGLTVML